MKNLLVKCWGVILKVYDSLTSVEVKVSIGDIILKSRNPDYILFIFASRYLDAKKYCCEGDLSFKYMNGISYKAHGMSHSPEYGIGQFEKLIESFQQKGYDPSSLLVLDRDLNLCNGTHRLALCLLNGIYSVNARIIRRRALTKRTVDWFYEVGLESGFIKEIQDEYKRIYNDLIVTGQAYICNVEGNIKTVVDDLRRDLQGLSGSPIISVVFESERRIDFSFAILNPCYSVCSDNVVSEMTSQRALAIESLLNKRYKDIVTISVSKNCIQNKA